jgi:hypothetical protein
MSVADTANYWLPATFHVNRGITYRGVALELLF